MKKWIKILLFTFLILTAFFLIDYYLFINTSFKLNPNIQVKNYQKGKLFLQTNVEIRNHSFFPLHPHTLNISLYLQQLPKKELGLVLLDTFFIVPPLQHHSEPLDIVLTITNPFLLMAITLSQATQKQIPCILKGSVQIRSFFFQKTFPIKKNIAFQIDLPFLKEKNP